MKIRSLSTPSRLAIDAILMNGYNAENPTFATTGASPEQLRAAMNLLGLLNSMNPSASGNPEATPSPSSESAPPQNTSGDHEPPTLLAERTVEYIQSRALNPPGDAPATSVFPG
ncbi:MAG: hypothetical protein RMJ35_12255 [Phycisphaerales bacterium]|nr:hypothetical protein [Phycisphaerales bacterium]